MTLENKIKEAIQDYMRLIEKDMLIIGYEARTYQSEPVEALVKERIGRIQREIEDCIAYIELLKQVNK